MFRKLSGKIFLWGGGKAVEWHLYYSQEQANKQTMLCKERAFLDNTRKKSHELQCVHSFLISTACVVDQDVRPCCARRNGLREPQECTHTHGHACVHFVFLLQSCRCDTQQISGAKALSFSSFLTPLYAWQCMRTRTHAWVCASSTRIHLCTDTPRLARECLPCMLEYMRTQKCALASTASTTAQI